MRPSAIRWLGAWAALLCAGWAAVAAYAVAPALPYAPVELPNARMLELFAPQGWAFFTRDPREDRTLLFVRGEDGWRRAERAPHGRPANAFGFARASRAQGLEMALLLDAVGGLPWTRCTAEPARCLEAVPARAALRNRSPAPTLCGTVGLALQPPVPWAWARARERIVQPSHVIRMEVAC